MAGQSRDKLNQYFQPGDVPTQTEYGHLIDSSLNLADPNLQIMSGTLSASNFIYNNLFINGNSFAAVKILSITESNFFGSTASVNSHSFIGHLEQTSADIYGNGENHPSYFLNHVSVGTTLSNANLTVEGNIIVHPTTNPLRARGINPQAPITVLNTNAVNHSISSSDLTLTKNLSASGYISASVFSIIPNIGFVSQLTSSGIISGGGALSGSYLHVNNDTYVKGNITSSKTGSFGYIKSTTDINLTSGHASASTYRGRTGKQIIEYNDPSINIGTSTDSLPVKIFGNITSSGISSSNLLYTSLPNASGNNYKTAVYDISSGQFYHTGSYKAFEFIPDTDWYPMDVNVTVFNENNFDGTKLTSSRAIQITASSTIPAFSLTNDEEEYDAPLFLDSPIDTSITGLTVNFLKNNTSKFIITNHPENYSSTGNKASKVAIGNNLSSLSGGGHDFSFNDNDTCLSGLATQLGCTWKN